MIKLFQFFFVMTAFSLLCSIAELDKSDDWLLKYAEKSTNELRRDKRIEPLIQRSVPHEIYKNLLDALSGPPDPVFVVKNRFISLSACVAHYCPMKGFFWTDIKSKIGIGVIWGDDYNEPDRLQIGSNKTTHDKFPAEAKQALINWLSDNDLHPQKVTFIEQTGKNVALDSADFQPPVKFLPPDSGPSFDCLKANGVIEKTICNNGNLASSDLSLSELFYEIKTGHAELSARKELIDFQRAWIKDRNAKCSLDNNIVSCIENSYKEQYKKLMNWIPRGT